jgi:hypothetical protein
MLTTRRWLLLITVVVFAVSVFGPLLRGAGAQPGPKPKAADAATIMQKKLTHAQKLLEGIALADLDKVDEQARELSDLSKLAEFQVLKTARYELHANEFRRALDEVRRGVRQKNLDAATLGYVDMTLSCVRCHTHVREVRIARAN